MNLSPELENAIEQAHKDAEEHQQGAVSPEHLFRVLLHEAEIRDLLGESGGNIPLLLATVDASLEVENQPSENLDEAELEKKEQEYAKPLTSTGSSCGQWRISPERSGKENPSACEMFSSPWPKANIPRFPEC